MLRKVFLTFFGLIPLILLGNQAQTTHSMPTAQTADWRFGVVESYESPADAAALGAAWTRVRFQWAEVQAAGPGSWNPAVSDSQINGEINNGRLVVGLLIGVPGWASDGNGLPNGLWLPYDSPENTWANYVREAVTRYNGRISHWTIWNEPDVCDPAAPGHTWNGSVKDFFQLLRIAYVTAKQVNPNVTIHLGAMTYFWDLQCGQEQYMTRLLREITADPDAAANNYYFDVATAHLYFQPNTVYDITQAFYGMMGAFGIWKPIWLVETNAPPIDDPAWPVPNWTLSVTQNEQAAFMPQALASALAAGAQRIAIYKLKDTSGDVAANPEPFGLVRMDGSRRPAFDTYRIATRYMAGMTAVSRERWNEVGQIRLTQEGKTTTVLFARLPAPQQALVAATANTALLVDMWGSQRTITARDGFFTVDLPGALCTQPIGDYCMIGGTTYYIVQSATGGPPPPPPAGNSGNSGTTGTGSTTTITATAAATSSATTVVTPQTATATPTVTHTATPRSTRTPRPTATSSPTSTPTSTTVPTVTFTPSPEPTQVIAVVTTVDVTPVATLSLSQPTVESANQNNLSFVFIGIGMILGLLLYLLRYRLGFVKL
ncbi:MAG: hypothetical protein IPL78_02280 [Chloroflexi bacterium]|nr:hypothetical protein [Chloroflexota bacterium]